MQVLRHKCSPQELRAAAYPPVGDQLDVMYKLASALREQGIPLPPEVEAWIESCAAVKEKFPK